VLWPNETPGVLLAVVLGAIDRETVSQVLPRGRIDQTIKQNSKKKGGRK